MRRATVGMALAVMAMCTSWATASPASNLTTRISVSRDGLGANEASRLPSMTGDGRHVAFASLASNLVPGDTNDVYDVFVSDRQTGTTTRVSVAGDGTEGNGPSGSATFRTPLSADGRFVAFESGASNLVASDTNDDSDIFVHDLQSGTTSIVSAHMNAGGQLAGSSTQAPAISADGRFVAFESRATDLMVPDTNGPVRDVFVHDRQTAITTVASVASTGVQADGDSLDAAISNDGRYVSFSSAASSLVAHDTNGASDVFVHDRQTRSTERVSVSSGGIQGDAASGGPALNGNGRFVAFDSAASNLVPGDANAASDVFLRDRDAGTTTRVSKGPTGEANRESTRPGLSTDGRYVVFHSEASNLRDPRDYDFTLDVFVRDRAAGVTSQVSVANDGTRPDGDSPQLLPQKLHSAISDDGRFVAFESRATNLVAGDTNFAGDVFIHDTRGAPPPLVVSVGSVVAYEHDEGLRAASFVVTLSAPSATTVRVDYATVEPTWLPAGLGATASEDFTPSTGTLSFSPGVSRMVVKVPVVGDTVDELHERFVLRLLSAAGAAIGDDIGVAAIYDDEDIAFEGRLISIGDSIVHEGDAGSRALIFNVTLSRVSSGSVAVDYATRPSGAAENVDFKAKRGTLVVPAGALQVALKVPVTPDTAPDSGAERITVTLSRASGATIADDYAEGTILDNDTWRDA